MINLTKQQPAPACLDTEKAKANGDYKCGEVIKRLKEDSFNKCYLCEDQGITCVNVEHFKAHKGNKDLKFDWNNLFFACGHCNNTKLDKYDDILCCTDFSRIITDVLAFYIDPLPVKPPEDVQVTAIFQDEAVQRTAQLLNRIYNGTGTDIKVVEAENLRAKLICEINDLYKLIRKYFYKTGLTAADKKKIYKKIKRHLSPETPFTAFKIWIIKANTELTKEFGDLLPVFQPIIASQ